MRVDVLMPQLGMLMTEGTLVQWLVANGATVACGQEILEIETEKVTHIITAPADGVLWQRVAPGEVVPVLAVLGVIGESMAEVSSAILPAPAAPALAPGTPPASSPLGAQPPGQAAAAQRGEIQASPIARRLAAEHQIDLGTLAGTGPGGRIVEADVNAAILSAAEAPAPARALLQRVPFAGPRATIARRMMASLESSAQLTVTREVDASALVAARQALLTREAELGARLSYDALLASALAAALAEHPRLNAAVVGDAIEVYRSVNVAVAIAAPTGLVTPVVRDVASRGLAEVGRDLADLVARAHAGRLCEADLADGTVTLTNLGPFGIDIFTPILNPPQSAILGVGSIAPRPVVIDGALAVRPTLHLCLTWDHCVADGADAAALLSRIASLITDAAWLCGLA